MEGTCLRPASVFSLYIYVHSGSKTKTWSHNRCDIVIMVIDKRCDIAGVLLNSLVACVLTYVEWLRS